ncbi:MAG: hypothetical protein ACI94Y_000300 [Maribacter sp.]|jgi:hypothetical protein
MPSKKVLTFVNELFEVVLDNLFFEFLIKKVFMKKNLLIKLTFIAIGAFVWMSHSGGRAAAQNQGNTGAPGDAAITCATSNCHGNSAISVNLDITIIAFDGSELPRYLPGLEHTIRVTVNHTGGNTPAAYGFQLVALTDSDNQETGSFFDPASNVQIATASSTGREYAEHDGPSSSNTFEVKWTAPLEGNGNVTLYAAGNGVNGNGSSSGDGGNSTTLNLFEEVLSGNNNLVAEKWGLNLYPNPVQSDMNLEMDTDLDGNFLMTIIDVAGRSIESRQVNFASGRSTVSVASLPTGNYSVLLRGEAETAVINMIKL